MNESNPCNIVLLPAENIASKAITLSENLQDIGTYFTLKDGEYFPHISLYMLQLKTADYSKVTDLVDSIAKGYTPFSLIATRYDQTLGFLDAEYEKAPELVSLQTAIIDTISPIRDGMRKKDIERMQAATGIKREYFEKYGYPNVGELFRPHLTLTRFTNDELKDTSDLPAADSFSGVFDRLGFFESGNNGTCIKLVAQFSLSNNG